MCYHFVYVVLLFFFAVSVCLFYAVVLVFVLSVVLDVYFCFACEAVFAFVFVLDFDIAPPFSLSIIRDDFLSRFCGAVSMEQECVQ